MASLLVAGRECGSCTMCCKVFRIPELEKEAGQWCRHVVQGRGCGIHAERPETCRAFFCHYMRNPNLGPDWRPDRAKFVLYVEMAGRRMVVASDGVAPKTWKREPYYTQFKRWAHLGAGTGHQLIVFNGLKATAILPDRDVDLGIVHVGDQIIYHAGPRGIDVEVRRKTV